MFGRVMDRRNKRWVEESRKRRGGNEQVGG